MASQQEARLNLVISAQDQASAVIRKVTNQIKSALDSINKLMSESLNMSGVDGTAMAAKIESEFQKAARAVETSVTQAAESASRALVPIGETATTVAEQMDRSFQNVEHALVPIGETAVTVAQEVDNAFRNAGNVIDVEFKVISDEIVRDLELLPAKAGEAARETESEFQKAARAIRQSLENVKESLKALTSENGLFGIKGQTDSLYAGMAMGAAALPIVGFIKDAIKAYADFDQAVANVNTMLHYHGAQLDHLKQQLVDLSKVVPQGPKELAQGLYSVVGAGVDAAHAMDVLKVSAVAAAAGQTNMDTSTRALITVMDSYGMKASQVKQISDVLFAANQAGAMTFRDLAASIGTVAGPAANAGVSFKEVAAATAALTNTGLSAQRATMGLRALIMGIQNPTKAAQKEAKQLGIEWDAAALKAHGLAGMIQIAMQATHGNTTELKKLIPNIAAYTAAVNLGGKGAQAFKNALDMVNNSAGATDKAMQAYKQSAQYNLQQFSKAWEDVKMAFAKDILPTITSVMQKLASLMKGFDSLSPGMRQVISLGILGAGAFLSLGSAMFMSISAIGSIITGVKELSTGLLGARAALGGLKIGESVLPSIGRAIGTILVSGLRSLGSAISTLMFGPWRLLINGLRALPGFLRQIPALFTRLISSIRSFAIGIVNVLKLIPEGILSLVRGLGVAWRFLLTSLAQIMTAIRNIIILFSNWRNVLMLLRNGLMLVRTALTLLTGPWGALVLVIVTGVSYIISHWNQIVKWVQQNFGKTIPTNFRQFQQLCSQVWTQVQHVFTTVWNAIKKVVEEAWNYIRPTIMNGIKEVQKYWNEVWPEIQQLFSEVWTAIKVILGPAVAWMYITISGALGLIKGAWKDAWNVIKDTLKFVWDAIVGIIKTGWDLISGVFKVALDILTGHWRKAWNDMKNLLSNVVGDIKSTIGNLISDAWQWGSNLVKMIGDGIMSGIHYVENAASTVASKIKDFLGFHSPTKEGPASDSDKWMPNMMKMFTEGIEAHRPMIQRAVNNVALDIKHSLGADNKSKTPVDEHLKQVVNRIKEIGRLQRLNQLIPGVDPFSEVGPSNSYDRRAGHSRNIPPTISLYDRYAGHGAHHVTVNIQIEGRSKETDRQLINQLTDQLGRKLRTHVPMHIG